MLPTGKSHVSYSEMKDWMTCSYRHKLKHVDHVDLDKKSSAPIFGTAFHSAVEQRLKNQNRELSDLLSIEERMRLDVSVIADEKEKASFDVDSNMKLVVEMSADAIEFLDVSFPNWKLLTTEENLYESCELAEAKHPETFLKGFIDLVIEVEDKKGKKITWIIDWKTSNTPWNRTKTSDPKVTSQLVLYKNFWANKHNVSNDLVRCAYIVALRKAKREKRFQLIPVSVGPTTSKRTLTVLNNFVRSVKIGMAVKNKSMNNCRWCEYKNTQYCK